MQTIINRMIPTQNNQISIIDRLRLYIDPVDSTWFARLKPANEEQITKLKQFLELDKQGLKLPEEYVNFLRYAGEGARGLFEYTLQAEMSIVIRGDEVGIGGYHGRLCFNDEKIAKEMERLLLSQIGARIHE